MPDLSTVSVKLTTVAAIVVVLGSILASWYSTNEQLKTATKEIVELTAQVGETKRANDEAHEKLKAQAQATEMKLYEAITTMRVRGIMP